MERMWRQANEHLADACVSKMDWFSGGTLVTVWVGISGWKTDFVVVNGNLTRVCYSDEILAQHVQPFMRAHQDVEIFQHDNAHTARVCTAFLQTAQIEMKTDQPSPATLAWLRTYVLS